MDLASVLYMILETKDAGGNSIIAERLLLPFAKDGAQVTEIVAAIELFSAEGTFERRTVFKLFEAYSRVVLRGRLIG